MTRQAGAFIGLTAIVSFLLGLVVAGTRPPFPATAMPRPVPADAAPLTLATNAPLTQVIGPIPSSTGVVDFGAVAARLNAAVVNVDTASRGSEERPFSSRRYVPGDSGSPKEGSGSGFIIDPAGYVLTNHHVVTGADRVTVTLSDGRVFKADVIGVDPAIDIALLQIHSRDPLPVAPLGNSDGLRVGEWVCAIGNPLGVYVHSVTVGVVSFLGRKLFDHGLDAFIQTDAAISFGNSGGPLINARGEVVGITTAISAQAVNIGFAIPISQVITVLPQLREHGSVARGYIAVGLTNLTPELRHALGIAPQAGALIQDVMPDTPPEQAGLRPYDLVVRADGQPIRSDEELIRHVSNQSPGTITSLEVWRDGLTRTVSVKLRERPLSPAIQRRSPRDADVRPVAQTSPLGIKVRDLDVSTADHLRIPENIHGVLVSDVDPAGPAQSAQVRMNQVLIEINRRPIASASQYIAVVDGLKRGDVAALLLYDRTSRRHVITTVIPDTEP